MCYHAIYLSHKQKKDWLNWFKPQTKGWQEEGVASSPPHLQMPLISTTMAANSDYHFVILPPSAFIFSLFFIRIILFDTETQELIKSPITAVADD